MSLAQLPKLMDFETQQQLAQFVGREHEISLLRKLFQVMKYMYSLYTDQLVLAKQPCWRDLLQKPGAIQSPFRA